MAMAITTQAFGETNEKEKVTLYTMRSSEMEVGVMDYGATITSIKCADKHGAMDDIVTGFTGVQGYETFRKYFGSTVGRVCNRIAGGKFSLGGHNYQLATNDPPNGLHGGIKGFDKRIWSCEIADDKTLVFRAYGRGTCIPINKASGHFILFSLTSKDGEEGYPGNLHVTTKYVLSGSQLLINYMATTDKETIVSMTNHSYFNLAGHGAWKPIYDHKASIFADKVLPTDNTSIPTGEIKDVEGTVFDLRKPQLLTKERLESVPVCGGYDHNFCLPSDGKRNLAARVVHGPSGRVMQVETTQPGIQFYTSNKLSGVVGKQGKTYDEHSCFCLETQNWPDAINRVGTFPDMVLRPGETYNQSTWYTFSTM